MILHEWTAFYSGFEYPPKRCTYITAPEWLVPHETAAVTACSVYAIQQCTTSFHAKPHKSGAFAIFAPFEGTVWSSVLVWGNHSQTNYFNPLIYRFRLSDAVLRPALSFFENRPVKNTFCLPPPPPTLTSVFWFPELWILPSGEAHRFSPARSGQFLPSAYSPPAEFEQSNKTVSQAPVSDYDHLHHNLHRGMKMMIAII